METKGQKQAKKIQLIEDIFKELPIYTKVFVLKELNERYDQLLKDYDHPSKSLLLKDYD
jgi:hypothetical protein